MTMLKVLSLMLISLPAMAGIVHLKNPPAPPGFPPFSLADVPYQYVTGFDGNGNVTGVVTYYANCRSGNCTEKAFVTWDLTGKPLYAVPCSQTYCAPLEYGPLQEVGGYPVFVTATDTAATVGILDSAPRIAVIVVP
jgi:hypothetical protein